MINFSKPYRLLKPWACTITNALVEDRRYLPGQLEQRVLEQIPLDYFWQTQLDLDWKPEALVSIPVAVDEVPEGEPGVVIPTIKDDPKSEGITVKRKASKSE